MTKTAAEAWAIDYLRQGQVVTRENITFCSFTRDFFSWEGQYVRSLQLRGRQIGQRHAANQQAYLGNYLVPAFGVDKLTRIDNERILELALDLKERGLSASTVNHILLTLRTILQYAQRKKYLQNVPDIDTVAGAKEERGVLTPEEARSFFSEEWKDVRFKAINMIAATTGMRLGEIMGLQRQSVHSGFLEVRTSWERGVGLKGTKTGRSRIAVLTPKPRRFSKRFCVPILGESRKTWCSRGVRRMYRWTTRRCRKTMPVTWLPSGSAQRKGIRGI